LILLAGAVERPINQSFWNNFKRLWNLSLTLKLQFFERRSIYFLEARRYKGLVWLKYNKKCIKILHPICFDLNLGNLIKKDEI
jgi:hypothetical protein